MFGSNKRGGQARRHMHPLLFVLAAAFALFVMDRAAALALETVVKASDHRLARIYAGTAKADILILGNSVGNAMLIPPKFGEATGMSAYSIASHGMDAITQHAFLQDYLDHQPAPRYAILEVRPAYSTRLNAPAFSTFQELSHRLSDLQDEAEGGRLNWAHVFHTYGFNSPQLPTIIQKVFDRDDQASGPSNGKINDAMKKEWSSRKDTPALQSDQLGAMLRSVTLLRSKGTKVQVVMAPIHPVARGNGHWLDGVALTFKQRLPADVKFADLSRMLSDDSYFEDPIHLNRHGRETIQMPLTELVKSLKAESLSK